MKNRIYHPMECALDALIPFCKWFIFPYFYWFVFLIGAMVYFMFRDKSSFIKFMLYVIITYTVTLVVYAIYPTSQNLRPEITGDGAIDWVFKWLYGYDTSTNVCPSLHVIGSLAACFAGLNCDLLKGVRWKAYFIVSALLICAATVFVKQHSFVDVFWGAVVSAAAYPFVFCDNRISRRLIGYFDVKEEREVVHNV